MTFIQGLFSEESDKPSFSRFSSLMALVGGLTWTTKLVWANHQLPDLGGIALLVGTLYGLNKAADVVKSVSNGKTNDKT